LASEQSFEKITELTDVQEGTIVRTITRLDDTCREVRDAARVIGDAALYQKMEACQNLIKVNSSLLAYESSLIVTLSLAARHHLL